jgi:hypothetical protein
MAGDASMVPPITTLEGGCRELLVTDPSKYPCSASRLPHGHRKDRWLLNCFSNRIMTQCLFVVDDKLQHASPGQLGNTITTLNLPSNGHSAKRRKDEHGQAIRLEEVNLRELFLLPLRNLNPV